jgi:hypothetical protein
MSEGSPVPVSSHDEWSPLREVVVGTPYHLDYHEDASFRLFFHQNLPGEGESPGARAAASRLFRNVRPGNQLKDECAEDLSALVAMLEDLRGVSSPPVGAHRGASGADPVLERSDGPRADTARPVPGGDVIRYEWLDKPIEVSEDGVPFLASQSIGMNVLSLDERHVVVQDIQVPLIRDLEKHGFTPVPARWRHGRSLGGGFHCVTLDIRRDSTGDFAL